MAEEFEKGAAFSAVLDRQDPLSSFRDEFHIPLKKSGGQATYLCGNSLGLQPRSTASLVQEELNDWARFGVEGHFEATRPWIPYHEFACEPLARLVGAKPHEVVAMNSLTINLHLMMVSFFRPTKERSKILVAGRMFPSDRYAVESQLRFHGLNTTDNLIQVSPRETEAWLRREDIEEQLRKHGPRLALVLIEGVDFYTGQAHDLKSIAASARAEGCMVGFDLAHAAGNIPLELHEWGADFAVWCSYKYLNGGPGCTAGCFVHERHADNASLPRFAGWWGNNKERRFQMGPHFEAIKGAEGWQVSNPPILALAALLASLRIFDQAGMLALREKSVRLTSYLEFLLTDMRDKVHIITPSEKAARGCQLSLRIKGGKEVHRRLIESGVICDWRDPDVIRIAPVPLYNRFKDVYDFSETLRGALP